MPVNVPKDAGGEGRVQSKSVQFGEIGHSTWRFGGMGIF